MGEYVSITSGEAPSKFEVGTELYVKVDDLNYNDKYVVDTQNKVAEHSTVKRVTKGSVVFPKRGAAIMTNKVRIMGIDSYMDTNMMALTSEKLDSEFLYNIISKEGLYKIADTSTIPQINNKHVEPYEVTIPSLDEQRKIGAYFKQLDHLITLHQCKFLWGSFRIMQYLGNSVSSLRLPSRQVKRIKITFLMKAIRLQTRRVSFHRMRNLRTVEQCEMLTKECIILSLHNPSRTILRE